MVVETLKQRGTWLSWREEVKMVVKTAASWSAQCFRVEDGKLLGSAAWRLFCFPKSRLTSRSSTMKGGGRAGTGWGSYDGSGVHSQTERRSYSTCRPSWGRRLGKQHSSYCSWILTASPALHVGLQSKTGPLASICTWSWRPGLHAEHHRWLFCRGHDRRF